MADINAVDKVCNLMDTHCVFNIFDCAYIIGWINSSTFGCKI